MNLTLHLTDNCNMDCTYCLREKCPKDMTEEVLFKACDLSFSKGKIAGLCFFGGEPLLKKDLIYKALDYCEEKASKTGIKFSCKMTTNGTLLDEEFILRAKKANMGIGLSFDGKAQDVCRFFVGGKYESYWTLDFTEEGELPKGYPADVGREIISTAEGKVLLDLERPY